MLLKYGLYRCRHAICLLHNFLTEVLELVAVGLVEAQSIHQERASMRCMCALQDSADIVCCECFEDYSLQSESPDQEEKLPDQEHCYFML